ncbi:MAG: metallophosphoesterase, partial [Candidatus Aminicenantes bacterium]|nr:metallophosphoesterase [Candidatus Aminicenantes bacterium]
MSKKKIYFISDVHLAFKEDDREKKKRKQLLDFLQTACQDANEIYILGDLFDFWFEWYHVIPKYWFPILYRLRKLVDTGVIVNFVTGNHDFFTGKYLEKEIGIHCF